MIRNSTPQDRERDIRLYEALIRTLHTASDACLCRHSAIHVLTALCQALSLLNQRDVAALSTARYENLN